MFNIFLNIRTNEFYLNTFQHFKDGFFSTDWNRFETMLSQNQYIVALNKLPLHDSNILQTFE